MFLALVRYHPPADQAFAGNDQVYDRLFERIPRALQARRRSAIPRLEVVAPRAFHPMIGIR